jgi:hypothetical protein
MIGVDHTLYVDGARVNAKKAWGGPWRANNNNNLSKQNTAQPPSGSTRASKQASKHNPSIDQSIHETTVLASPGLLGRGDRRHHHWRDLKKVR